MLGGESNAGATRRADPLWLRGVKYTFVTAVEACIDVVHHICATQGWGPPRDNGDALRLLGAHAVLTEGRCEPAGCPRGAAAGRR